MNTSALRVSFAGTLAVALLSSLAPTRLIAEDVHAARTVGIKHPSSASSTAAPEPSSFVLLGTGLVIAALALRSKGIGIR